ncbi:serine/threonine-protein kinase HAL4/sat4 [Allomyces arbusculus]|nr:serine/threonine-protein kinase HAL4/sat4 [Allomyces arbusculus]
MTTSAAASPDTAAGLPAQPVSPPSSPPVARARKLSTPNAVAPATSAATASRADLAPAPVAPALPTPSMTPPLLASPKLPPALVVGPATPPAPVPVTLPSAPPSPPAPVPVPVPVERRSSFKEMLLSMKNRTQSLGRSKSSETLVDAFQPLISTPQQQRKSDAAATKAAAATAAGGSSANDRGKLTEKYGVPIKGVIGKGATAQVRLVAKPDELAPDGPTKIYAVKEFRKRRKNETEKQHMRKLTAEFCISSSLHHINVVETIDLIQDENEHWCEVMEYCAGGDLYSIIKTGQMDQNEIDCCFKQLVMGVHYLHAHGIGYVSPVRAITSACRCNLLLNTEGHLKITDFGVSEVFKMCWESEPHLSKGICGSEPYIAPEEFAGGEYDARQVDVWAVGVVYYAMTYRGIPWKQATKADPNYAYYLSNRKRNFEALDRLPNGCRELMYKILEPDPKKRITIDDVLADEWFKSIQVCFHCPEYDHPADPLANVNHAPPTPRSDANHIHHINVAPLPPIPVTPTAAAHQATRSRSNSATSAHLDAMLPPQAAAAAASPPRRTRSRSRSITAAVLGRPPAPQPAMPAIPSDADVALADSRSPQRKSSGPSRATSPTGSTGSKGSDGKRKKRPSLSRIEAAVKDLLNF